MLWSSLHGKEELSSLLSLFHPHTGGAPASLRTEMAQFHLILQTCIGHLLSVRCSAGPVIMSASDSPFRCVSTGVILTVTTLKSKVVRQTLWTQNELKGECMKAKLQLSFVNGSNTC